MSEKCVLAIDLGTSACKVALVSVSGRVLAGKSEELPLQLLPGGGGAGAFRKIYKRNRAVHARLNAR